MEQASLPCVAFSIDLGGCRAAEQQGSTKGFQEVSAELASFTKHTFSAPFFDISFQCGDERDLDSEPARKGMEPLEILGILIVFRGAAKAANAAMRSVGSMLDRLERLFPGRRFTITLPDGTSIRGPFTQTELRKILKDFAARVSDTDISQRPPSGKIVYRIADEEPDSK